MKKMPFNESQNSDDDLLAEYNFDYLKAKANRSEKKRLNVVVLDEDGNPLLSSINKDLKKLLRKALVCNRILLKYLMSAIKMQGN